MLIVRRRHELLLATPLHSIILHLYLFSRYAYRRLEDGSEVEDGPVASSLLKGNLRPWPRGSYGECAVTTRVGVLARKIGVVPMWRTDGKPIMATMLHVKYRPAD